jgi:hypothetical protein
VSLDYIISDQIGAALQFTLQFVHLVCVELCFRFVRMSVFWFECFLFELALLSFWDGIKVGRLGWRVTFCIGVRYDRWTTMMSVGLSLYRT